MPADFPRNEEDVRLNHQLLDIDSTDQMPIAYLTQIGYLFAVFDEHLQDSGNISYGVQIEQQRFFVKTAGDPYRSTPLSVSPRRELLCCATQSTCGVAAPITPYHSYTTYSSPCMGRCSSYE